MTTNASSTSVTDLATAPTELSLEIPGPQVPPAKMTPADGVIGTVNLSQTFIDDFSSFRPNASPWRHYFDHGPYTAIWARTLSGNNEEQVYVDPDFAGTSKAALGLNPFEVNGGVMKITGSAVSNKMSRNLGNYRLISGLLSSEVAFEQQYGFFEARMKFPVGQGLWPAFWLKRAARLAPEGTPSWPPEIDIVEYIGTEGEQYHVTSHWGTSPDNKSSSSTVLLSAATTKFHNYGVLWTEDRTVFYFDRKPVRVIETKDNHHVPMFMMLNLALGGKWPGPVDPAVLPASVEIDWVAAWQIAGQYRSQSLAPAFMDGSNLSTSGAEIESVSYFRLKNTEQKWGAARITVPTEPGDRLVVTCKVTPETAPGRIAVRDSTTLEYVSDLGAPGGESLDRAVFGSPGHGLSVEFQTLSNTQGASVVFSDAVIEVFRAIN